MFCIMDPFETPMKAIGIPSRGKKNAYQKKNYCMFIKFQVTQLCLRSYELSMISQIHW